MAIINFPILYIPDPDKNNTLFNGQIYVGEPGQDAANIPTNQKQLRVVDDNNVLIDVVQPFKLSAGGVPVYQPTGQPVRLDVEGDFSLLILDKTGQQKYYIRNVYSGTPVLVEDLPQYIAAEFATVADMIAGESQNLDTVDFADYLGRDCYTVDNNDLTDGGGHRYTIVNSDPGDLSSLVGGVWVGKNHALTGGVYYARADDTTSIPIMAVGAVCDADGNTGVGQDDTAALQAAHDQLGYIYLPTDRAPRITAPLERRSLKIFSDWIDQRGVIGFGGCIVLDDVGATDYDKFLYEPRYLRNVFFLGTSKICTGLAIERGDSISSFLGWARYENVTVSGCKQGVHMGNCFNIQIDHMIVEENEYGFGCEPFNTAGDDGYVTTVTANKLICRQNDQWGLFFNPELKSPNIAFNNLNIETNNQVGGTYQMLIKNLDPFSGQEWYLEGAETADCFFNNGGNRGSIAGIYQNSCGPFNLTTLTLDLEVSGHKITATGDVVIATGGANQMVSWSNSTLLFDGGSLPSLGQLELKNVTADGTYYNDYKKGTSVSFNQNAIGAATNGFKGVTAISPAYVGKTIVAGTNNTVISDTFFGGGIMENTTAIATFRGEYQPSLMLQVHPRGSDANTDYYRVMAYNFTGSDVVLPGGTLDIVFIKTE